MSSMVRFQADKEGEIFMMDIIMLVILTGCIGSVILLIGWCHRQIG